jgi:hypothetical protein
MSQAARQMPDPRDHAGKVAWQRSVKVQYRRLSTIGRHGSQGGNRMAPILTPEDVVKRIAAECAFVDERGAVGIRLEPAAAIVRQYGEQFRVRRRQRRSRLPKPPPLL